MLNFFEKMNGLPKGSVVTCGIGSMLTASMQDLRAFSTSTNPKVMPGRDENKKLAGKVHLSHVSWFQGSLALSQAMTRDLSQGETRLGLVNKCLAFLERSGTGVEASLKRKAVSMTKK